MAKRTDQVRLLNIDVDNITMDELLEVREGAIMTLHVDMIAKLQKDRDFYDVVNKFDIVTCDSQILYFAAKALRTGIKARVSGSDMFPMFYTKWKDDPSVTIFLCGAMEGIAEVARDKINAKVGREIIVGTYSPQPGFQNNPEELAKIAELVNESKATVMVAGVAAGVQEGFLIENRASWPLVKLVLPLGGTIDYEAGSVKRPPAWITTAGAEWLWRLVREPGRRWRRYLVHQPPVLVHLAKQMTGTYKNPFA